MPAKQYVFTVQPIRIRHAFNTYSKAHEYVFKSHAIRIREKAYTYLPKSNTYSPCNQYVFVMPSIRIQRHTNTYSKARQYVFMKRHIRIHIKTIRPVRLPCCCKERWTGRILYSRAVKRRHTVKAIPIRLAPIAYSLLVTSLPICIT